MTGWEMKNLNSSPEELEGHPPSKEHDEATLARLGKKAVLKVRAIWTRRTQAEVYSAELWNVGGPWVQYHNSDHLGGNCCVRSSPRVEIWH